MEEQKEEIKVKEVAPILVDENQAIVARDNAELFRLIQTFMAGTAFPKTIDTPQKAIAAWQIAASLNLPPMVVIQNLAFIHGSISMWGQLPKALAERTGQLTKFKLILFDEKQDVICLANKNLQNDVWGAATQIQRKKGPVNEYFFNEIEAKKAGLFGKSGPWTQYKKIMYSRRAVAQGIKFEFPDALMGVPVAEYDFNHAPDISDFSEKEANLIKLKNLISGE